MGEIDHAIHLARQPGTVLTIFGDLLRVPGSKSSLIRERAEGSEVRVVYSPLEALQLALEFPDKKVIFFACGFETTAPGIAATLKRAREVGVPNFLLYSALRLLPPALHALAEDPAVELDGLLCPGHVSTVIGVGPYEGLARRHGIPCAVAGFEPLDILQGILMLLEQVVRQEARVENQYRRAVPSEGNPKAVEVMKEVFEPRDVRWRGLGVLPGSGLGLQEEYAELDATVKLAFADDPAGEPEGCICGEVLRGIHPPVACPHFGGACCPETPLGPCMVSSEGACRASLLYRK
jgi:hydrogenase expression/formation protein HypD